MIIIKLILNIIFLFFPLLFLLIFFIVRCKETTDKIKLYEKTFGVIFTKEVLEDMKDIPPESYNYNPAVFVPEYEKEYERKEKADFSQFLINEVSEEGEALEE